MATFYVDSNASGVADGTSFTDAFASVVDLPVLAPGDDVRVASDHVDTLAAQTTIGIATNGQDVVDFISVNSATEIYETGAAINNSDDIVLQRCAFYGFTISCDELEGSAPQRSAYLEECAITCRRIIPSSLGMLDIVNCVTVFTSTTQAFVSVNASGRVIGGSMTQASAGATSEFFRTNIANRSIYWEFIGVDLSASTFGLLVDGNLASDAGWIIRFIDCALPTTVTTAVDNRNGLEVELINCISGPITNPALGYVYEAEMGSCEVDTAVTRRDGASDGTTAYSMRITALADQTRKSLRSMKSGWSPISIPVEPGDTNIRIYVAHDGVGSGAAGRLQSDECWATYQGPDETSPFLSASVYKTTKTNFRQTPADLTDDDSVWTTTGTPVGTVQRIDIPIAPGLAGTAQVWLHLATGSASDVSAHFDRKIDVS